MALNQYGIGIIFSAKDHASAAFRKLGRTAEETRQFVDAMQNKMMVAGKKMAQGAFMVYGGIKAMGKIKNVVDDYADFESVIRATAQISGVAKKGYNELYKAAEEAGIKTMYSPKQAALALRTLAQAGLNARDQIATLNPVLNTATASFGKLTPEGAAGLAVQAMKAYGYESTNVTQALDIVTKASNSFYMGMDNLQLGLSAAARGALATNQSLKETVVTFGLVKNAGLGTERAATSVAVAMERLARTSVQKNLKNKLGVDVIGEDGKFRDFLTVINDIKNATEDMGSKRAGFLQTIFGQRGMTSVNVIMKQLGDEVKKSNGQFRTGADVIANYRKEMGASQGTVAAMAKSFLTGAKGQMELATGSWKTLKIRVGKVFAEPVIKVFGMVTKTLNTFIVSLSNLSPELEMIISYGVPLAALGVTILGVVKIIKGLMMMATVARAASMAANGTMAFGEAMKAATVQSGRLSTFLKHLGPGVIAGFSAVIMGAIYALAKMHAHLEKLSKKVKETHSEMIRIRNAVRKFREESKKGNAQIASLGKTITNTKTAMVALQKTEAVMSSQRKKIFAIDREYNKAQISGNKKLADKKYVELLKEQSIYKQMLNQRKNIIAKATLYELKNIPKGTHARLKAENQVTAYLKREMDVRKKAKQQFLQGDYKRLVLGSKTEQKLARKKLNAANAEIKKYEVAYKRMRDSAKKTQKDLGVVTMGKSTPASSGEKEEEMLAQFNWLSLVQGKRQARAENMTGINQPMFVSESKANKSRRTAQHFATKMPWQDQDLFSGMFEMNTEFMRAVQRLEKLEKVTEAMQTISKKMDMSNRKGVSLIVDGEKIGEIVENANARRKNSLGKYPDVITGTP